MCLAEFLKLYVKNRKHRTDTFAFDDVDDASTLKMENVGIRFCASKLCKSLPRLFLDAVFRYMSKTASITSKI